MKLFKEIGVIIALSIVIAFVYNYFSPKGLSIIRKEAVKETVPDSVLFSPPAQAAEPQPTTVDSQENSVPAVKETRTDTIAPKERSAPVVKKEQPQPIGIRVISLEQFTRLVQEKRTLILDAREPEEYSKGRVPGAINIPYLSVDQYFEKLAGYPRDTLVAIYCNNIMCPLGRGLAEFMVELEFKHLLLFEEGWDRWEREEMPIEH